MTAPQYAGDPANYPATIPLWDDSVQRDASHTNPSWEGLADRTANINARVSAAPGVDWLAVITGVTGQGASMTGVSDSSGAVLWDESNGVWLVSYTFPTTGPPSNLILGGLYSQTGFDPSSEFLAPFGAPSYLIGGGFASSLAQDGAIYFAALMFPGTANSYVAKLDTSVGGPAWASSLAVADASVTDIQLISVGGKTFAAVAGNGAFSNILGTVNHGASWTTLVVCVGDYPGGAAPFLFKNSGTQILAVPTNPSANAYYVSSDGGATWGTAYFGPLLGTFIPSALAWGRDAIGPCWILAAGGPSPIGNQTAFFRSVDGVTWTAVSTTTTAGVRDLVCLGSLWVATTWDQGVVNPLGGIGASYVIVSTDGAATWHRSQGALTRNISTFPRSRSAKLATNGRQICLYNSAELRFSRVLGASPALWT